MRFLRWQIWLWLLPAALSGWLLTYAYYKRKEAEHTAHMARLVGDHQSAVLAKEAEHEEDLAQDRKSVV